MYVAEIAALTLVLVILTLSQVYINYKITQIAVSQLAGRVEALNQALGDALSSLAESGILAGEMPHVNPIMEIITEVLKNNMNQPTAEVKVIPRKSNGQFGDTL